MCTNHVLLSSQLDATASQLNSNDAFVLATPGGSFLWVGAGASDGEKQGAQQLCDILGVSASELSERGESSKEVWIHAAWAESVFHLNGGPAVE